MELSDYCFQVAFGIAPTIDRAWKALHRAKIGEGNAGDSFSKVITPSLFDDQKAGVDRAVTLSGIERAITNVHFAYRQNVLLLDLDLDPIEKGEREGYDWEESCLVEDTSFMDRLETIRKRGSEEDYQMALGVYRDSAHIDGKTGLLTQIGYVHQKRILKEKIENGDIKIPNHFRPLYVAADLCNMKAGNDNIGETSVNPFLDAFGEVFNLCWRSPNYLREHGLAKAQIGDLPRSRRSSSSGIFDLSFGRLGRHHVTLRPNGTGGDEGVVWGYFPGDNREIFKSKLLNVQTVIYQAQQEVARNMFGQ